MRRIYRLAKEYGQRQDKMFKNTPVTQPSRDEAYVDGYMHAIRDAQLWAEGELTDFSPECFQTINANEFFKLLMEWCYKHETN